LFRVCYWTFESPQPQPLVCVCVCVSSFFNHWFGKSRAAITDPSMASITATRLQPCCAQRTLDPLAPLSPPPPPPPLSLSVSFLSLSLSLPLSLSLSLTSLSPSLSLSVSSSTCLHVM